MIRMQLDPKSLADMKRTLDALGQGRQLDFALSKSINTLAEETRRAVRKNMDDRFTIAPSRRAFLVGDDDYTKRTTGMIKFWPHKVRRSKTFEARVGTSFDGRTLTNAGGGSAKERSALIGRHEKGGTMTAKPGRPFFIPSKHLRPGPYDIPPRRLYPSALRLADRQSPNGILPANANGKGKRRAFVLRRKGGGLPIGIFERVSQGHISPLWWFKSKVTIKPRLGFYDAALRVWHARGAVVMQESVEYALRTAIAKAGA